MTDKQVAVRFAPSPTGYLHIGGARTALFNYLYARKTGGRFLLRVEDTDRERSTPEAVEAIFAGLEWLGLEADEEPLFQSRGADRHRELARGLLESGSAYRCFCSRERLERIREQARAEKRDYHYDRACLGLDPAESLARAGAGEPHVVRFKVPPGETVLDDRVYGDIRFRNETIDDFIILRTDGTPTYQLAVVADDIEMGITHIIRGDDHLSNTPKQALLYRALGRDVPVLAHVPLILGPDKKRLSKRHGATSVIEYREAGFLPEALFNFLALLGWSPGDDRELMTRTELFEAFSLEGIGKKSAVFDQTKLEWMNGRYMSQRPADELLDLAAGDFRREGLLPAESDTEGRERLLRIIDLVKDRCRLVGELVERTRYFFPVEIGYDEKTRSKRWKQDTPEMIRGLRRRLEALETWSEKELEEAVRGLADELGVGAGKVIHPLRLALTGTGQSPGMFETMELVGRELCLSRIDTALEKLG